MSDVRRQEEHGYKNLLNTQTKQQLILWEVFYS
jgi:hypothetical protein